MSNNSFVFYQSFYDAVKEFDNDTIAEFFKMVCDFALTGVYEESENKVAKALFIMTLPQIEANQKRREYAKKGGAPKGNTNAKIDSKKSAKSAKKQPMVDLENNKKQPMVDFQEIQKQPNVNVNVNDIKEKKNIINNIPKKEKADFDGKFRTWGIEIATNETCGIFREELTRKYGIKNWLIAMKDFKSHIISQANEDKIIAMDGINDLKRYMSNALAKSNFLSDEAKKAPKADIGGIVEYNKPQSEWRKPCKRLPNEEVDAWGTKTMVGVILQDGKRFYCSPSTPEPPSRWHYYNPIKEQYDDTQGTFPMQYIDEAPKGIMNLPTEHYLLQRKEQFEQTELDF